MKRCDVDGFSVVYYEKEDILLPDRSRVTNKGDCGRILVVGSDSGMAGASIFSAMAAQRTGAGLVELMTHADNRTVVQTLMPEAIYMPFDNLNKLSFDRYTCTTIGMGLGQSVFAHRVLEHVILKCHTPLVIDADGINILSHTPHLLEKLPRGTVLTPHLMEFSRLTGERVDDIKKNKLSLARDFADKYGVTLVLKDAETVVTFPDQDMILVSSGDSTLSKGGSGDILSGMIASLIGQGMERERAVPTAVYLHGLAGKRTGERLTPYGALARDIIEEIPSTLKDFI